MEDELASPGRTVSLGRTEVSEGVAAMMPAMVRGFLGE